MLSYGYIVRDLTTQPGDRYRSNERSLYTPAALCTSNPLNPNVEDYWGSNMTVATCRLPLQTVGKIYIQQHLANLDTMSILVSDTLVSRAEPPPSGWTDIVLEETYKYWSS